MSYLFRELLKKVGSGQHTGHALTREEAAQAMKMMLEQTATPAQIGGFMIAHRIRRPEPAELAGMLDACLELGPRLDLQDFGRPVVVFGNPYDGRSRSVSVMPVTSLILAACDIPILLHGGGLMPTKYGLPLINLWYGLGIDWSSLTLEQSAAVLLKDNLGFVYIPTHFPLAQGLVTYREEIGKRPSQATMELAWAPTYENVHMVVGFVHPPTETRLQETLALMDCQANTMVKGLEGSCDLSCNRTSILSLSGERLILNPWELGFQHGDVSLESETQAISDLQQVIAGQGGALQKSAVYNAGFYLWRFGVVNEVTEGFAKAEQMLGNGDVQAKLDQLKASLKTYSPQEIREFA